MTAAGPPCPDWEAMLHGLADGELDAAHALDCERHVAGCSGCAAELGRIRRVRGAFSGEGVRWRAPEALRARIVADLDAAEGRAAVPGRRRLGGWLRPWAVLPWGVAVAASLLLALVLVGRGTPALERELVAAHVRSLLVAEHLTDVASSDRHTVKPWFAGRIDFAPLVPDLADGGFPLVGGRVDYVGGRVVAALVYRRHGHLIDVFVWPGAAPLLGAAARDGYNLLSWAQAGLVYWAVSDLDRDELAGFERAFRARTGG